MENLIFSAAQIHKQRMNILLEEARIERFLNEKKHRDANAWQLRRLQRNRKSH